MIRLIAAVLALVPLAASAAAPTSDKMTLAEARSLSPQQLAERLLGAAGASGKYFEAKVYGDGGVMIHAPGLNGIDLYKKPKSAGNPGLCEVEGVHVDFETSRYNTPGDPPHRVSDFWKLTRFAMLMPSGKQPDNDDGDRQDRDCAKLTPVVGANDPTWFATPSNSSNDAYFATRAMVKAQAAAVKLGSVLTCGGDEPAICAAPAAAIAAIPIRRIHFMEVKRCPDGFAWCVHTIWEKSSNGKDPRMVELDIRTDAAKVDWGTDFNVVGIKITSGVWIVD